MNNKNWKLWNNITFKTQGYHKNFDFIYNDENIVTEYEGSVSEIRIDKFKSPMIIGEYGFSVWNVELGLIFGADLNSLVKEYRFEETYSELQNTINKNEFNFNNFKKVIFLHTFILRKEYRKCEITEELVEMLYRGFYGENIAIIALVKPLQDNPIDVDFFYRRKSVQIKESIKSPEIINVPAYEYYSLNELREKSDREINEYKIFAVANKCGFSRINGSYLFKYSPENTIARMMKKRKRKKINEEDKV